MNKPFLKYIIALLLFGFNGIVASRISLSSYEIVFLRTMIGSALLLLIFLLSKGKFTFIRYKRQFAFLCFSGVAMGTSWLFLYEAYQHIGVSIASLAYSCGPVIVLVLSPLLFRERLTRPKSLGFLVVLIGAVLVNSMVFHKGNKTSWGLFCGAMSAVTYSFMVIFNKKAARIAGLENATLQLIISFLTVAVFIVIKQGFDIQIAKDDWVWIIILGVLNTGLGCYFYFSSIGHLPVQTVAICSYLEPLSAVIFSVLLLRESLSPLQIVGAVLILGGAIFAESFKLRAEEISCENA